LVALSVSCFPAQAPGELSIRVAVDLTDAPRNIFHSTVTLPATAGDVVYVYPKWIPGNHRPSGPIANVTGLHFRSGDQELVWHRDPIEMYSFHITVPPGVKEVEAKFDLLSMDSAGGGGLAASSSLLDLNWNQVVLYPDKTSSDAVEVTASVRLPAGWKFGTSLTTASSAGGEVAFRPLSLTMLVDSPLIAGENYRQIELVPAGEIPSHVIDMVGDSPADLEMTPQDMTAYRKLVMKPTRSSVRAPLSAVSLPLHAERGVGTTELSITNRATTAPRRALIDPRNIFSTPACCRADSSIHGTARTAGSPT
jgi:predicted metalloprotease with PDZ domain